MSELAIKPFTQIDNDMIRSKGLLSVYEKTLLITLKSYGQNIYPSLNTLSAIVGCSKSTIQRAIKTLQSKNIIRVYHRSSKSLGYMSNLYELVDGAKSIFEEYTKKAKDKITYAASVYNKSERMKEKCEQVPIIKPEDDYYKIQFNYNYISEQEQRNFKSSDMTDRIFSVIDHTMSKNETIKINIKNSEMSFKSIKQKLLKMSQYNVLHVMFRLYDIDRSSIHNLENYILSMLISSLEEHEDYYKKAMMNI